MLFEDINNSAYLNYFIKKDNKIRVIYNNLLKINDAKKKLSISSFKVTIKPNPKIKIQSFANILHDNDEIDENTISEFFQLYINSGPYKGQKYIFDTTWYLSINR